MTGAPAETPLTGDGLRARLVVERDGFRLDAALSVAPAAPLAGAKGVCFSVEPTAAGLAAPVDAGVYCYDGDGTLTGVRAGFGTLVLSTAVSPAPPSAVLPGPVVAAAPLPTAAPPPPSPSA